MYTFRIFNTGTGLCVGFFTAHFDIPSYDVTLQNVMSQTPEFFKSYIQNSSYIVQMESKFESPRLIIK